MQQPFGFFQGGVSPFRTLLNTVRPDVPKPIQATGFLRQPSAAAVAGRIFDASIPTYPTAFVDVRASNATYFNSSGVLSTASSNTQRIDYNPATLAIRGLLVEDAATNIVPTNDFTAGSQFNVTIGSTVTSLDGTSNAYPVTPTAINGKHWVANSGGLLPSTTNSVTFSAYVKANGYSQVGIVETNATFAAAVFSLASGGSVTGTFNSSPITVSNTSITDAGGGWFRISCTMDSGGANFGYFFGIYVFDGGWTNGTDPSAYNWTPNGTSGIIASFRQAEVATSVSSYIYTSGSSATRAADAYSFTLNSAATQLTFTFDDLSTQVITGLTGGSTYNIPTNLNRPWILYIDDDAGVPADTGVGAATGTSTVAAIGASLYAGVGSAAGTSTVSGVGTSLAAATASAAGTSTVTATGKALFNGVGSAAGTSTVTATGAALGKGIGNAAGTSTVLATGQSTAASVGASAGVSTVSGVGAALAASVGSAAGTSTDTATGSSLAKGVGNAAGTSTALAVSGTVAAAAGTSAVIGVGAALFNAVGAAAGTSTVTAAGVGAAFAVGVSSGTSTVSGIGKSLAVAVGSAAGAGTATGFSPSLIMQAVGLATGSAIVVGVGNAHRPGTWQIAVRGTMDIPTPWKIGNTAIDTIPTVPGAQSIYSDSTPDIYQVGDIYSQTAQNTWKVATRGTMDIQTAWKIAR